MSHDPSPEFVTIATRDGRVRGRRDGDAAVFLGIPYAAPPTGPLRWRPPQPAARWSGVRDALQFGPDTPQPPGPWSRAPRQSEDCLYLNVWTPTMDRGARLPVLVWLHGGGFSAGSGADSGCDGRRLAAEGAVVVTLNYRCGLFGFLAHPGLSAESEHGVSGNYGLHDQLAALAWVRENIAGFGGDPDRVTAFGVSAGSASIALLLASPLAQGAFQRAILQSPGAGRPLAGLAQAEQAGRALGDDLAALRALPAEDVLARTSLLTPAVRGLTTPRVLRPIRDGWLIPEDERSALRGGRLRAAPMIVGTVLDEGSWATRHWKIDGLATWRQQLEANFGAMAAEAGTLYPAASDAEAPTALAALFADTQFNYGARLLARGTAASEPKTWKYLFTRRRPRQADGPHHAEEGGHVFGTFDDAAPGQQPDYDTHDEALSQMLRRAWVAFARDADPNATGMPRWDRYRIAADNHLELGDALRGGAGWRAAQLDFIERFYAARD